jgi:hypothetical protein
MGEGRDLPLSGRGLLVLIPIWKQCMSFQFRARMFSPTRTLSKDTITAKKHGLNACMVRTA